jgi:CheY-like chemotaxis protein
MEQAARILIIDDDQAAVRLLVMLLMRLKAQTVTAANGAEGLRLAAEEPYPDLIILDLVLPDMNGLEVLQQIRSKPEINDIPVIILSVKADPPTIRRCLSLGADDYVTKPYAANSLLEKVYAFLAPSEQDGDPSAEEHES